MVSLVISIASLLVGIAATWIAGGALRQAKEVAEQQRKDWKQRKWFDLYFKADEAYDALDHFRMLYPSSSSLNWGSTQWQSDWNNLMRVMRTVNRMALVFPKNSTMDALFAATGNFAEPTEASSSDRLQKLLNAVEDLRQNALVDLTVLAS